MDWSDMYGVFYGTEKSSEMMLKILTLCGWLLRIISETAGEEGVLLERLNTNASWNWLTRWELGKGSGWSRDSMGGSYVVCDMETTKTDSTDSWLVSEFINVEDAKEIHIQLQFTIRQCPQMYPHCVHYFKLRAYQVDEPVNTGITKSTIQNGSFVFVDLVNATNVWLQGQKTQNSFVKKKLEVTSRGVYFGFQDVGACVALNSVIITYKFCKSDSLRGVRFGRTVAPLYSEKSTLVTGTCANHSSPLLSDGPLIRNCLSNGEWTTNNSLGCVCNAGYELVGEICQACEDGFFKSSQGNVDCLPCPAYSKSIPTRNMCSCQLGYFRAAKDPVAENCTRPPSSPTDVKAKIIADIVVVLMWSPPLDHGGRTDVTYDVKCSICFQNGLCASWCRGLQFWPSNQSLTGHQVTISNFSLSGYYNLTVMAKNGVSDQAVNGKLASLVIFVNASTALSIDEVDLTTSPPTPDEVVNARDTASSKIATVVGVSVVCTIVVCFIIAAVVVTCLMKYWKNTSSSLDGTKRRDLNYDNGSTLSTRTTTTDAGRYRSSLTSDEPIDLKYMQKKKTTNEAVVNGNSTNEAPFRLKLPKKSSPRSVSPILMKPWEGPPRVWDEQNGGTPSNVRNLYKNGF